MRGVIATLRRWARGLKQQALVVYCIARDPRTPWIAKGLALVVAAYAFSPVDLIPDFIPVLGLVDDLVLVPLGVWCVLRLVPPEVRDEARTCAAAMATRPVSRAMAATIIAGWCMAAAAGTAWAVRALD